MPIQQTYKTGTITVTSGSATVTGTGTAWLLGLVNGGDLSFKGRMIPIRSVESNTQLTLDTVAPADMAGTGAYSISLGRADAASAIVATRQLADLVDILRTKVGAFGSTLIDDVTQSAALTTLGVSDFIKTLLDDANQSAALGTLGALPASNYTAADVLAKLLTVDTNGAGINASTLQSTAPSLLGLSLLSAASQAIGLSALGAQPNLGFAPVQQGTGIGQASNAIKIGWTTGAFPKMTVDSTDVGRIWTDIEVVRGFTATSSFIKFPGGGVIQAGIAGTGATERTIVYPTLFPNRGFPIAIPYYGGADSASCYIIEYNAGGLVLRNRITNTGAALPSANFWIAFGN